MQSTRLRSHKILIDTVKEEPKIGNKVLESQSMSKEGKSSYCTGIELFYMVQKEKYKSFEGTIKRFEML